MRKQMAEMPFHCKMCEKAFAENNKMNMHMRIHAGEITL